LLPLRDKLLVSSRAAGSHLCFSFMGLDLFDTKNPKVQFYVSHKCQSLPKSHSKIQATSLIECFSTNSTDGENPLLVGKE
jgi:hypothetical protein